MMQLVMQFPVSNGAFTTDGNDTAARTFETLSSGLIIGVLVLGLIPGCGPP
jgi:hypothetical protein